jgi:hypothetical protein
MLRTTKGSAVQSSGVTGSAVAPAPAKYGRLAYISLGVLVVQNTSLVLMMRCVSVLVCDLFISVVCLIFTHTNTHTRAHTHT